MKTGLAFFKEEAKSIYDFFLGKHGILFLCVFLQKNDDMTLLFEGNSSVAVSI